MPAFARRGTSRRIALTLFAVVAATSGALAGEFSINTGANYIQTVSPTAWMGNSGSPYGRAMNGNSFETSTITTFNGYQYAAFWRNQSGTGSIGVLSVARRPVGGAWQVLDVPDMVPGSGTDNRITNGPNDAHNVVSLGINRVDGTIHLAYDMHGHTLRYRVSALGVATNPGSFTWNAGNASTIFSTAQRNNLNGPQINGVTYPMFINTPTNDLQLAFRVGTSGNGSWWIYDYSGTTHAWSNGHQIDDGTIGGYVGTTTTNSNSRNNYPNNFTYGSDGRLHSTFTWRESATGAANHDLLYVYSDDGGKTWLNNAGSVVGSQSAETKFQLNSPGLVVRPLPESQTMMNQNGGGVDRANKPHAIVWHRDSAKEQSFNNVWEPDESSYFQYWRDDLGNWHQNRIDGNVGTRPKIYFDEHDNAVAIYSVRSGGGAGSGLYPVNNDLVIAAASKSSNWTDWKIIHAESGPFISEAQADPELFAATGILSVIMQNSPTLNGNQGTPLRTFDFDLNFTPAGNATFSAASGLWSQSINWSGGVVPATNTIVHINNTRSATVNQAVAALDNVIAVGSGGSDGTLNISAGASLDLLHSGIYGSTYGGSIVVGRDGGASGVYQQTGGVVSAWRFAVGDYFNETSGGGLSTATISGGTLITHELNVAFSANGSSSGSSFNVNGGTVIINGDAIIAEFGNSGSINLAGGRLTIGGDLREGFNKVNSSTFRMDGGTLDMTGNFIAVDRFIYNGGTILNVNPAPTGTNFNAVAAGAISGMTVGTLEIGSAAATAFTSPAGARVAVAERVELHNGSTLSAAGGGISIGQTPAFTPGQLVIRAGGMLAGNGTVNGLVNLNGGTISPGLSSGSITVVGDFIQAPAGTIDIELGGAHAGSGYDQLNITGVATLNGTLRISSIDDFVPLPGTTYDVLTFRTRIGAVTLDNDLPFAGLVLDASYLAGALRLTASALFDGDANLDGRVDIADLSVLAQNWQSTSNWLGGDFDGNGTVDAIDLAIIAGNWQAGAASLGEALVVLGLPEVQVPEPAAGLLVAFGAALVRRRR